jgi:hypothetical protein
LDHGSFHILNISSTSLIATRDGRSANSRVSDLSKRCASFVSFSWRQEKEKYNNFINKNEVKKKRAGFSPHAED